MSRATQDEKSTEEAFELVEIQGTYIGRENGYPDDVLAQRFAVLDNGFAIPIIWVTSPTNLFRKGYPVTLTIERFEDGSFGAVHDVIDRQVGELWDCVEICHGIVVRNLPDETSIRVYIDRDTVYKVSKKFFPGRNQPIVADGITLYMIYRPEKGMYETIYVQLGTLHKSNDITVATIRYMRYEDGNIRIRNCVISPFLVDHTSWDDTEAKATMIYSWQKYKGKFMWLIIKLEPFPRE